MTGLLLAYSGGLDSTVLLHLARDYAATRGVSLRAHHVDHALQAGSAAWSAHCARVAAELGVVCTVTRLTDTPPAGASIEDWARQRRYQCLLADSNARTALMTAHHQDDQAETVLLHALRASGPHGLAGIRAAAHHGDRPLWRPLLEESRASLRGYARTQNLEWIDDPSNVEQRYARNRLRAQLMPLLEREFPGAVNALAEVARLQGEVVTVLDALADDILGDEDSLPLAMLRNAAAALRPYVVKRWLARRGAPTPARAQLQQLVHDMLDARRDALPVVSWREVAVRRYDDRYFLTAARLAMPDDGDIEWSAPWPRMSFAHGALSAATGSGAGLSLASLAGATLRVRCRVGGERLRLHRGGPRRELKHLFQEWRVPPWQRGRWPLIYLGEHLAAVPGKAVAAEFRARADEASVDFDWQARD